jgi:hypothetical protein
VTVAVGHTACLPSLRAKGACPGWPDRMSPTWTLGCVARPSSEDER